MGMVTPIFKFLNEEKVLIIDKETGIEIGQIETPAATIPGKESAIQVCGFDYAECLWGCGVYATKTDKGIHAKKDIQLLFCDLPNNKVANHDGIKNCEKCYSNPCKCDELHIYQSGEPMLEKL